MSTPTKPFRLLDKQELQKVRHIFSQLHDEGHWGFPEYNDAFTGTRRYALQKEPSYTLVPECLRLAGCFVMITLASSQIGATQNLAIRQPPTCKQTSGGAVYCARRKRHEDAVVDFYEPAVFDWNDGELDIIRAVQKYCESAYADCSASQD
jgi:hypothetical protein